MPAVRLPTGIDLYYESHGDGEPLVLIPATGFCSDVWQPYQVPELSKHLRLLILDPRGCGRSTHYEGVYTIDQQGCDVVALLEHLKIDSAHVLGHSMGGRVGLSMALNFPGRVKSLIMAASGSGPAARPGATCVPGVSFQFISGLAGHTFEEHIRHFIVDSSGYFSSDFREQHPEQVEAFYELAWRNHALWPEYVRQVLGHDTWEATHRLGDLVVPTLIVIGTADDTGADHVSQARVLRERIPQAEFVELKGQSHGFFWQAPDETNQLMLDWVRRHADRVP